MPLLNDMPPDRADRVYMHPLHQTNYRTVAELIVDLRQPVPVAVGVDQLRLGGAAGVELGRVAGEPGAPGGRAGKDLTR